jgi:murein L,D-transpeptidase YcbB/YkuD
MLVAGVKAAITRGLPGDDGVISNAWVRYVQALKRPVQGVSFGDPALELKPPSPGAILSAAARARWLGNYVERTASINPFYAALREAAIANGADNDPHVRATLDRLRLVPAKGKAIVVDAASAQLTMLEDGRTVDSMKVIVGKPGSATPLIASTIHYVTLNPYWHLPPDFARRKVAPLVLRYGVGVLKGARYETVAGFGWGEEKLVDPASIDWRAVAAGTAEAHLRQLAGPRNSMGLMKFGFDNDYGIFLHDTPHKDLFAKTKRDLSLGCVRLEHPERLAEWLLGREPVAKDGDSEQNVLIARAVPVFITSLTARADDGQIAFADDVYKLDSRSDGGALLAVN